MVFTCILAIFATLSVQGIDAVRLACMVTAATYLRYPNVPKFQNRDNSKLFYDDYVFELYSSKVYKRPRINFMRFGCARGKKKRKKGITISGPSDDLWDECEYYHLWGNDPTYWYYQRHYLDTFDPDFLNYFASTIDPLKLHEVECITDSLVSDVCSQHNQFLYNIAASPHPFSNSNIARAAFHINSATDEIPIVLDTGASTSLSPVLSDFPYGITKVENQTIQQVTATSTIEGKGICEWNLRDNQGNRGSVQTYANYMPGAHVRLFSPQHYFQMHDGKGQLVVDCSKCVLELANGEILTFSHHRYNNLPMASNCKQSSAISGMVAPLAPADVRNIFHDQNNQNLTRAQQKLLGWHWRFAHASMKRVQSLMKADQHSKLPVIQTLNPKASTCDHPMCAACRLARPHLNNDHLPPRHSSPEILIRSNDLIPGDCVSVDQYICRDKGRLPDTAGKEKNVHKYSGGYIAVDHASAYVHVDHQVSLRAGETLKCKHRFENFAGEFGIDIKKYRSDNGIFASSSWMEDCEKRSQTQEFSGVGAQHQNAVAERSIQTLANWARSMLIHAALHWPDHADTSLWPFAMTHAAHVWNHMPKGDSNLAPIEIFSGSKLSSYNCLKQLHVWGCPVFVLDPKLQDGKKLPKWKPRARLGQYLGVAPQFASTVGNILNLESGYISPQYHVVHDDFFTTVPASLTAASWNALGGSRVWERLYERGSERYVDPEDNIPIPLPGYQREQQQNAPPLLQREGDNTDSESEDEVDSDADNESAADGTQSEEPEPATQGDNTEGDESNLPRSRYGRPLRKTTRYNLADITKKRFRFTCLNNMFLHTLDWDACATKSETDFFTTYNQRDPTTNLIEIFDPLALATKANASDNPNWYEATNGPQADGYWQAMGAELETLKAKDSWEVVERTKDMNVLPSTWAFKCKRFPDGSVRKLKARFCVRGDKQKEGIDYFETYAPVVSWQTVRMLMILSIKLNLCTKQVDYTAAFVQAPITEEVYVEPPRGFPLVGNKVLKLCRCLYGLKQAPRNWFNHLKTQLKKCDLKQSNLDPCLFLGKDVICLVYVDDCLLYAPKEEYIDSLLNKLKVDCELDLNVEDNVAGFLGVLVKRHEDGTLELTQSGLIDRILKTLGLDPSASTATRTPTEGRALGSHADGEPCQEPFSYPSVIGMLMYLSANSRPDLAYAVHQCARFTHSPKRAHEQALKRIGRYLLGTKDKGLILKPNEDLNINCFADADFAGLWGIENSQDPISVKSRSGWVIMVGGCPVIWASKMQTETALSTMQAEYIALSSAMRDLLPFKDLMIEITSNIGLSVEDVSQIRTTVWEDNNGALILANLEPGRTTSRSKHFAIKYHWFREKLIPNNIKVEKVDTKEQIADILTKGLTKDLYEALRKMLVGW